MLVSHSFKNLVSLAVFGMRDYRSDRTCTTCYSSSVYHKAYSIIPVFLGKWIVTPEYVLDSLKLNTWLPEALYEVNLSIQSLGFTNPVQAWREKVARGVVSGAFQVNVWESPNSRKKICNCYF